MSRGRALLFVAALALGTASACGGMSAPCVVPATGPDAITLLDGTWSVSAYDGEVDGLISFEGGLVSTTWEDVRLVGTWEHLGSTDNAHRVRLRIDEAWENGVRQRFGSFDEVDIEIVFANPDRLFALQPDGAWTAWERVAAELTAPVADSGSAE